MKRRRSVPKNVERSLWAESCGWCMNPSCKEKLITTDQKTSIAEMAHIKPHSQGGDISFENLILLCRSCHKLHESVDRPEASNKLSEWKVIRRKLRRNQFAIKLSTFDELATKAKPLLLSNQTIFESYGPNNFDNDFFKLWQIFEKELIVNNSKLKCLFENNLHLFPNPKYDDLQENQLNNNNEIRKFIVHVDEFEITRDNFDGQRKILFPDAVLSIFGIEKTNEYEDMEQSVAKTQNLIGKLKEKGFDVKFELLPNPKIIIDRNGEVEELDLTDRPRVKQLLFAEKANKPYFQFPINTLLFFYECILNTGCIPEFINIKDLTKISVNDRFTVKILYSYEVSENELHSLNLANITHIINLYNWNGGIFSRGARQHALSINIKPMNQNDFLKFCHKQIKR